MSAAPETIPASNEWTVMFFFASDNELSPLIVSQLKAIKDAGFQKKTDVLLYFDANERGTPTRLYHVNKARKKKSPNKTMIGDGEDPYIRNLAIDDVNLENVTAKSNKPFTDRLKKSLTHGKSDTTPALEALKNFIGYCRENHRAKHYLLFLVGHGMIVANDAFLPDEEPRSAITLKDLGLVMHEFSDSMKVSDPPQPTDEAFELLALHSCSMSAVEVAYELKGTAKYMMGSEGISFVGSWPYRQLLKKLFKTTESANGQGVNIETLLQKLYFLSLYNSTDFMLSGYSSELSLCSLDPKKVTALGAKTATLVRELKKGLDNDVTKELILLAYLKSQSYWNESYTDLYDFCSCLATGCASRKATNGTKALLTSLGDACGAVVTELKTERKNAFSNLVVFSEHFGPKYQYSHGLSVYFPWSEPVESADEKLMENYSKYLFTTEFQADESWMSFLQYYFLRTKRVARLKEDGTIPEDEPSKEIGVAAGVGVGAASSTVAGGLGSGTSTTTGNTIGALERKASGAFERKASGAAGGGDCSCPSIKNYADFSISPGAAQAFKEDNGDPAPE